MEIDQAASRVIEDGIKDVVVYRAKEVANARSASEQMVGQRISSEALLNDLRTDPGVDTALGLPHRSTSR